MDRAEGDNTRANGFKGNRSKVPPSNKMTFEASIMFDGVNKENLDHAAVMGNFGLATMVLEGVERVNFIEFMLFRVIPMLCARFAIKMHSFVVIARDAVTVHAFD